MSRFFAEHFGHLPEMVELERRFAAFEISKTGVADFSAHHFAARHRSAICTALERARWMAGIEKTVRALRARALRLLVTTVMWTFAAEYVVSQ